MTAREFYHYYQTSEHAKWEVVTEANFNRLKQLGAKRASILAVSPLVDGTNKDNVYYKGPFYVDIDRKDLADSIASAQQLLARVRGWGIQESSYIIFCSGSKGFHFYFHPKLFYSGKPLKKLPQIYAKLASNFWVPGLDFQPYCGGKGNLFRLANVQREDGKYKTYISPAELETLTVEQYLALTSVQQLKDPPRLEAPISTLPSLIQFFQEAEEFVTKREMEKEPPPIPEGALLQLGTAHPPCIGCLIGGDVRPGMTYNQVSLQMATYLVDSRSDQARIDSLSGQLANKLTSNAYNTFEARYDHTRGIVGYLQHSGDKRFSCPAMRSVLSYRPCKDCTIEEVVESQSDHYDIEERKDGYYMLEGRRARRITSFTLVPQRTVNAEDPIDHVMRRAYVLCSIDQMGERLHEDIKIPEDAWLSRGAFVRAFSGVSNLKITGTDNDIQSLKHWVMRDTEALGDQIEVSTVGIHANHINQKTRFTYVEQGFSINKWGVQETHVYPSQASYRSSALPLLQHVATPDPAKHDYETLLRHLFSINDLEIVAPLIGWLSACHLKSHFMSVFQEFPLFVLWGGRGSGKTKTACAAVGAMNACDYLRFPPPTAGQTSLFAVIDIVTGTTTVPRVVDEFNRHGCKPGYYETLTEIFKAGYNNASMGRGRLTRNGERGRAGFGATTDYFFVTSPILLLSEHAPETPALLDRTYLCMLREPAISGKQEHMLEVTNNQQRFWELVKYLTAKSLDVRLDILREQHAEWGTRIHQAYTERQAHVRRVIGVGLQHLQHVFVKELKLDIAKEISELIEVYTEIVGRYESVAEHAGYQTEIDRILMSLGGIISMSKRRQSQTQLPRGVYEVDQAKGILYVDVPMAYLLLEEHYAARRETMPLRQSQQFERIMAGEKYYIGRELRESMTSTRTVVALDMKEMKKKSIDTSLFIG